MPKLLPKRWQPECILEFRAAARQRFDDGFELAARGRRTGAIYLWGYCAEMSLKAAYFSIAMDDDDHIKWNPHILGAIDKAKATHGIIWPQSGAGHNVRAWAELLVAERASIPGRAYPSAIGREIQTHGQRIGSLWSETLRYHKNLAYQHEMTQVRLSSEWLLTNLGSL